MDEMDPSTKVLKSGHYSYRWAKASRGDDMDALMGFIRALAAYENESASVKTTEEQLTSDLEAGHFCCALAMCHDEAGGECAYAGFALCHTRYSTWDGLCVHLEDLFVPEEFRGMGVGRGLMEWCVLYTRSLGCKRLCWEVLDWNTKAKGFYEKLGAEIKEAWQCVRLSGEGLENFEVCQEVAKHFS
ncbi:N-acetyltransferase [Chloropicon primus]|uniref:N-acetyltransferase n=1 Tax=Chloropicon primus TaxID=1764295 RepID=A0A5B8MXU8_9CHLO|nr:N-acetyltransferase [Chloropicon primus]UPR04616.1 N-acetyltransferase [Chloropicon primus]|eukprot:QDZ25419.1 N-acetyltransferase [Chloropicon primus]